MKHLLVILIAINTSMGYAQNSNSKAEAIDALLIENQTKVGTVMLEAGKNNRFSR